MKAGYRVISDYYFNCKKESVVVFNFNETNVVSCLPCDKEEIELFYKDEDSIGMWKIKNKNT